MPNGIKIGASASHDRTVRIWDISNFTHLKTLEFKDFVWRVFIVKGNRPLVIAFVSAAEEIHVCDLETCETVNIIHGRLIFAGNMPYFNCPFVMTAFEEDKLQILDAETGVELMTIDEGFEKVFRAVVSPIPDWPLIIFTTWNAQNRRSTIQTFLLGENLKRTSKFHLVFEGDSRDGVTSVVASKKPVFCSGHYDSNVRVWDLFTGQLLLLLEGHMDWVISVAIWRTIDPIVVSGSSDGTIKVWDLQTGGLITTCEGHLRDVWSVTVTHPPSGRFQQDCVSTNNNINNNGSRSQCLIVSASSDRTVRVWDINNVILDRKWERRKNFPLFLVGWGFRPLKASSFAESSKSFNRLANDLTSQSKCMVFQDNSLCREIASYL